MVHDTRASRRAKDGEDINPKGKDGTANFSLSSDSQAPDSSGVRRSNRDSSAKKSLSPSPSIAQKSERQEKQTPNTLSKIPVKRKLDEFEKRSEPLSLRRSERGKNSDKSSDSSIMEKHHKREDNIKQLTLETESVTRSERKKKRHARAYRELFVYGDKDNAAGNGLELSKRVKLSKGHSIDNGGVAFKNLDKVDKCGQRNVQAREMNDHFARNSDKSWEELTSSVIKGVMKKVENVLGASNYDVGPIVPKQAHPDGNGTNVEYSKSEDQLLLPSCGAACDMVNDIAEEAQEIIGKEVASAFTEKGNPAYTARLEISCNFMDSKPQEGMGETNSDAIAMGLSKDACNSAMNVVHCSLDRCEDDNSEETSASCNLEPRMHDMKHQRTCFGSTHLNQDFYGASLLEERAEMETHVSEGRVEGCTTVLQAEQVSADFQLAGSERTCSICKLGGKLICCKGKGCRKRFHLSCLGFHLKDVTFGVWHCYLCVRRKVLNGIHAVSDGLESLWDCREVEVSDGNASQQEKQYFVKYKGLAHLHNRWVPESEVLHEAPSLLAAYRETQQVDGCKREWTLPRRLLRKRLLVSHQLQDANCCKDSHVIDDCNCEWLVKWLGLGYEHATWEAENASVMSSPEAKNLVIQYESRCEWMKKDQHSLELEKQGIKIGPVLKLPPGLVDNHLDFLNSLQECWNKELSSVLIDDQERLMKVVSFISLLLSHVSWPFLIVTTSATLSTWDEQFFCLAPSVDVVVYHGDKDVRKGIRMVEFGEEGCLKMSQVVIISPEVISEDLDVFTSTKWAAVVVDECQFSGVYAHLEQVKVLNAHMMLLLVNGQPEDEATEYLLSLLDYRNAKNDYEGLLNNSSLKERLSKYIVATCKLDSRFLEYWIPVGISSIQLELLCANLLSNSLSLCLPLKMDEVGSLQDILTDARKCCDHPYLLDTTLQASLVKGRVAEILDVGIKASGKLRLLDLMLSEMRSKGLRVLVLFQNFAGQGKINIGDILDDFVRQRFGCESYERLDSLVVPSRRQTAMHNFNNEEGRFVFLLETRACSPSIKLSSVGAVIIFGSDWTPMNDIRNLQKLTLDSKLEQIKLFRLYSSHTVEEKALILARQHNTLDSRTQNISRMTSHVLLMWGASYKFDKLAEFHASNFHEQVPLKDVILEFSAILHQNGKGDVPCNCSLITKAPQTHGGYSSASPLPNEQKIGSVDEELPHMFWKKVLTGKQPKWRFPFASFQTQRKRERVQYFDDVQMDSVVEEEVSKKQKKIANNNMPTSSFKPNLTEGNVVGPEKQGVSGSLACNASISGPRSPEPSLVDEFSAAPKVDIDGLIGKLNLHDSQTSLHLSLKPMILKLCEVLCLPENVRIMVARFLEYVMSNHHVNSESTTILQAFQISLCWTAASLVKHKLSHKESLELAKQHLNFGCKKEEADYVYSMLRCLKKLFLYRTGDLEASSTPVDSQISLENLSKDHLCKKISHPTGPKVQSGQAVSEYLRGSLLNHVSDLRLVENDFSKSIKDIEIKFHKKLSKLIEKQKEEKEDVRRSYDSEKAQLEKKQRTEAAVIRLHSNGTMKMDKLRLLDVAYTKKFEELKSQMEKRLKNLEDLHFVARNKLQEKRAHWVEEVKSWALVELTNSTITKKMEENKFPQIGETGEDAIVYSSCSKDQIPEGCSSMPPGQKSFDANDKGDDMHIGLPSVSNDIVDRTVSGLPIPAVQETPISNDGPTNIVSPNPPSTDEHVSMEVISTLPKIVTSTDALEANLVKPSYEGQNLDGTLHPNKMECVISIGEVCGENSELNLQLAEEFSHSLAKATVVDSQEGNRASGEPRACLMDQDDRTQAELTCNGITQPIGEIANVSKLVADLILQVPESAAVESHNSDRPGEIDVILGQPQDETSQSDNVASHLSSQSSAVGLLHEDQLEVPVMVADRVDNQNDNGPWGELEAPLGEHRYGMTVEADVACDPSSQFLVEGVVVDEQVEEVPNVAPATDAAAVVEDDFSRREGNEVSAQPSNSVSCFNQLAEVIPSLTAQMDDFPGRVSNDVSALPTNSACCSNQQVEVIPTLMVQMDDFSGRESNEVSAPPSNSASCSNQQAEVIPSLRAQILGEVVEDGNSLNEFHEVSVTSDEGLHQTDEASVPNQTSEFLQLDSPSVLPVAASVEENSTGFHQAPPEESIQNHEGGSNPETHNHSVQPAPPVRMPALSADPLENELEMIIKEREEIVKNHEDMKMQNKLECEKEIEQEAARIRQKYDAKLQEMESSFNIKKEGLDEKHNKVLMNKVLAEALRFKCMDVRGSSASGMQQEMSNFMHQPCPQLFATSAAMAFAGPAGGSNTNVQTITPPVNLASTAPRITAPVQVSSSVAPPHVSSFSPITGDLLASGEICAPPHLRHFRPATAMPGTTPSSVSCGMPSQPLLNNPSTVSLPSQIPSGLPPSSHHQYGPHNTVRRQPGMAGILPPLSNPSLSAMELLMELDNRSRLANNDLPNRTVLESSLVQPQVNCQDTNRIPSSSTEVVCLSDDE